MRAPPTPVANARAKVPTKSYRRRTATSAPARAETNVAVRSNASGNWIGSAGMAHAAWSFSGVAGGDTLRARPRRGRRYTGPSLPPHQHLGDAAAGLAGVGEHESQL